MEKRPSLLLCIVLDAIGYLSYFLPFFGEFGDVVWAPISGLIFYKMFGGKVGLFGGLFNFAEELIPWTDFIPTFTIAWLWSSRKSIRSKGEVAKQ